MYASKKLGSRSVEDPKVVQIPFEAILRSQNSDGQLAVLMSLRFK